MFEHIEMISRRFVDHIRSTGVPITAGPLEERIRQAQAHGRLIRKVIEDDGPADLAMMMQDANASET